VSFGIVSHPNSDSKVGCAIVFGCHACLLLDLMGVRMPVCQLFIVLLYANVRVLHDNWWEISAQLARLSDDVSL
jgi:hypothetical protein